MDGHCVWVNEGSGKFVGMGACTGKPDQRFSTQPGTSAGSLMLVSAALDAQSHSDTTKIYRVVPESL
jgi:hypothetical protein